MAFSGFNPFAWLGDSQNQPGMVPVQNPQQMPFPQVMQQPAQPDVSESPGILSRIADGIKNTDWTQQLAGIGPALMEMSLNKKVNPITYYQKGIADYKEKSGEKKLGDLLSDPSVLNDPQKRRNLIPELFKTGNKTAQALAIKLATEKPDVFKSNYGKALQDTNTIREMFGENSNEYKMAKENLERIVHGSQTSLEVDPTTGAVSFSQGSGSRGAKSAIVDGTLVTSPSGATVTATQKTQMANAGRELATTYLKHDYIGRGSNAKLLSDWNEYQSETNPTRKKILGDKLVDAAAAFIVLPDVTALALNSQNIRATVPALRHQREAMSLGWPIALKGIVDNLPPDLQERARERGSEIFDNISNAQTELFAKGFPIKIKNKSGVSNAGIKIPSFKSRQEFNSWYSRLPSDQQAQVYKSLPGGK